MEKLWNFFSEDLYEPCHCATSTDSQRATGQNKHHGRRPPGLMGGASAKHAPAVTPIITEDSNPLSDRGRHLPSPPLQAQATITREDHPGLWAEQAPTMLHQSSLKTRTLCPTMQTSCVLTTDTTIFPPPPPPPPPPPFPITGTGM